MPTLDRAAAHTLLRGGWGLLPSRRTSRILYFHSVGYGAHSTSPQSLDAQLAWMRRQGWDFVTMSQIPSLLASGSGGHWVCLTFDDGYKDNRTVAAPILAKHGALATFFVVASYCRVASMPTNEGFMLYPDREMLNHDDVAALADAGHEIGSHGWTHDLATSVMRNPARDLTEELTTSRQILEKIAGVPVTSFAYPNGQTKTFDMATRNAVELAGFTAAATTRWGTPGRRSDLLALPRCCIDNAPAQEIVGALRGQQDYRGIIHRLKRSPGWPPASADSV
jgi:peptidoglycan/xylan/chitin deacetylase (PgdA/CDA1 family)